jgi:hypothetical protein
MRSYLEKPFTKIGLAEWLKVKVLSSSPSATKKKEVLIVLFLGGGIKIFCFLFWFSYIFRVFFNAVKNLMWN